VSTGKVVRVHTLGLFVTGHARLVAEDLIVPDIHDLLLEQPVGVHISGTMVREENT